MRTQDALAILETVQAKTYTRNDQDNAPKIGFIAQDIEAACTGNFACLVGSTAGDEDTPPLKTLDYARLSSILWTVCRNLHSRLTALETANGAAYPPDRSRVPQAQTHVLAHSTDRSKPRTKYSEQIPFINGSIGSEAVPLWTQPNRGSGCHGLLHLRVL